jgi:hypothetical protein
VNFKEASGELFSYGFDRPLLIVCSGYCTFIPINKAVCGTLTFSGPVAGGGCAIPICTGNVCTDQLNELSKGGVIQGRSVRGVIFMVLVDCITQVPLPDEKQDIAYSKPGVKQPRQYLYTDELAKLWNSR